MTLFLQSQGAWNQAASVNSVPNHIQLKRRLIAIRLRHWMLRALDMTSVVHWNLFPHTWCTLRVGGDLHWIPSLVYNNLNHLHFFLDNKITHLDPIVSLFLVTETAFFDLPDSYSSSPCNTNPFWAPQSKSYLFLALHWYVCLLSPSFSNTAYKLVSLLTPTKITQWPFIHTFYFCEASHCVGIRFLICFGSDFLSWPSRHFMTLPALPFWMWLPPGSPLPCELVHSPAKPSLSLSSAF